MLTDYAGIASRTTAVITQQNWVFKLFAIAIATLAPLAPYVHFLVLLLILDMVTSIYYQFRQNVEKVRKSKIPIPVSFPRSLFIFFQTIESGKLRKTVEKLVAYVLGIIVCYLFDTIVLQIVPALNSPLSYFSVANVAVVMICSVEVTSILANLSKITNNPVYNRIIRLFNQKIDDKLDQL